MWKLPWLILFPIDIIGVIYGKCITLPFVLKIYTFIYFKNRSESERTALICDKEHFSCIEQNGMKHDQVCKSAVESMLKLYVPIHFYF